MAGVTVRSISPVPSGTVDRLFRPSRDFSTTRRGSPSLKRLGYFRGGRHSPPHPGLLPRGGEGGRRPVEGERREPHIGNDQPGCFIRPAFPTAAALDNRPEMNPEGIQILQPRVARSALPWGARPPIHFNPVGVESTVLRSKDSTLSGLGRRGEVS